MFGLDQRCISHDGRDILLHGHEAREKTIGLALSGQVILHASHDDWGAKSLHATLEVGGRQSVNAIDTVIEHTDFVVRVVVTDIGDSQLLLSGLWMNPQINAHRDG